MGKWSTRKGCQCRKPRACSAQSVYKGGCFHCKALAREDKHWASKALLKLPGRQNGLLVSIPPFPAKGCGSSSVTSAPIQLLARPQCTPLGFSCLCPSPAMVELGDLGSDCWERVGEKPQWKSLLFPWEPPVSSGPQPWCCMDYKGAVPVPSHAPH